ncbi:MAG: hypothetical protein EHM60_13110 [Lysobacterales bacterium]|nr:MAG: hypothetical protein EHM60_13110 [Xanthomonadales bacterium]
MVHAGRTAAGWLAGRVILFLIALAVLVAAGVLGDRDSSMRSAVDALVPDAELAKSLQEQQVAVRQQLESERRAVNVRLGSAHAESKAALVGRVAALDEEIGKRKAGRPGLAEQAIAFATGQGAGGIVENEARIQLLVAERDSLIRLIDALGRLDSDPGAPAGIRGRPERLCGPAYDIPKTRRRAPGVRNGEPDCARPVRCARHPERHARDLPRDARAAQPGGPRLQRGQCPAGEGPSRA